LDLPLETQTSAFRGLTRIHRMLTASTGNLVLRSCGRSTQYISEGSYAPCLIIIADSRLSYGINTKEPPSIGFYPIRNETLAQNTTQTPEELASFFSVHSATVTTTLPNFLLATPSYTTPPYALNSSIYAPVGAVVTSDLATSTYSALFGTFTTFNASAIPTISPNQSFHTLTDSAGRLTVSASRAADVTEGLGLPPGWTRSSGSRNDLPLSYPILLLALLLSTIAL
jgi:hypothetical protein